MAVGRRRLTGWGRTSPTTADVAVVRRPDDVAALLSAGAVPPRGVVARGLGRSYGDAAQNAGGLVLDMAGCDRILAIDVERARVQVEAGVSIDTLTRTLLPLGLWLPVVPGTRQVTVGGALAADVHGKNHHVAGSFGAHVVDLDLVTADGEVRTLTPRGPGAEAFWATVGGMGLTGVVVRATLSCIRTETAYAVVRTERARDLDHLLALLAEDDADHPYSVAWFDALARGRRLGRAVLTRGRLAMRDDLPARLARRPTAVGGEGRGPAVPRMPHGLLNRGTGRAFNELWYRRAPRHPSTDVQPLGAFFQPLDGVRDWNRLYGPRGFCQYQFVVPLAEDGAFRRAVAMIAGSGHPSCLNVLKRMGATGPGLLSFPAPGWTLAVDLPVAPGLERLFERLDELVLGAGGRVYLAKDARLAPDTVAAMYPRLPEFRSVRAGLDPDGLFLSDLARRVLL